MKEFMPLSNYIVLDVVIKQKGKMIVLPDSVNKTALKPGSIENVVVAISQELDANGKPMVKNVKVGDKVILSNMTIHSAQAIMIKGKEYVVVRESELIGIQLESFAEESNIIDISSGSVN